MYKCLVLTIDFKSAFACFKTDVIADFTLKNSSVCPVNRADGQHSVAIVKTESSSRLQRSAVFHPHSGREVESITSYVDGCFTFY